MNQRERIIIAIILGFIATVIGFDIITDSNEGASAWHLLFEAGVATSATLGIFYLFRSSILTKHQLEEEKQNFTEYKIVAEKWRHDAEEWKKESQKYINGLSLAIDAQLSKWELTSAEKEVALLLLKGLSLKEVADIRGTTEKTTRVQSMAIYSKSGLSGRSELAAYFLEDLLMPAEASGNKS